MNGMDAIEQWYVCENCCGIGPLRDLQADCRPGWTHGRLIKVDMASPVLRNARGAVERIEQLERDLDHEAREHQVTHERWMAAKAELDRLRGR